MRLPANIFTCNGIVFNSNLGIILEVIPAAGAGPVKGLATNSYTCSNGDNGSIAGRLATDGIRRDSGALYVSCDIIFT